MKNPFRRKKPSAAAPITGQAPAELNIGDPAPVAEEAVTVTAETVPEDSPVTAPDDGFDEWCRSQVRGGVERRERNDIYEAYTVYGADAEGRLVCRYYHRYPEHEKAYGLSYERVLSFGDFNRRLLAELDRGDMRLGDYNACIDKAERIAGTDPSGADGTIAYDGFSTDEEAALRAFCDAMDNLKDMSYLHSDGVLSCECESIVGGEKLIIRFRKALRHDALGTEAAGVKQESIGGYDIDNMWIMGVYNRLRDRCSAVVVTRLSSEWSIERESLYLMRAEGFNSQGGIDTVSSDAVITGGPRGVEGGLLVAVGEADSFRRFGFYSLDFSKK